MATVCNRLLLLACCLALFAAPGGAWSAPLAGGPPVTRLPISIEAYPQNTSIAQDAESVLYVGNAEGVLLYDGGRWKLLRLPNKDMVRSLAFDGGDRVYVGGYNLFGFIARDETGEEQFHDLTPLFAPLLHGEAFADIWDTHVSPHGIFFRGRDHVFLYRPASGETRLWRHEGRFGAIAEYRGETLLQFRGVGLKRLQGEDWQLVPGGEAFRDHLYRLLRLPDGGLLTLAADGRWREYREGKVTDFAAPAELPSSASFAGALELGNGMLALAGVEGSVYLFDPASGGVRSFHIDEGRLPGLVVANDGGLITGGNEAVYHIAWSSPWSVIGRTQGLGGTLHSIAHWGARSFALTGHGVYEAMADRSFRHQDWSSHEAWDLLALDDGSALFAESYTLKLLRGRSVQTLGGEDLYPRILQRSAFDRDIVYIGTENGLAVLRRRGAGWQLHAHLGPPGVMRVDSVVEAGPRELWLGSERNGVLWLRLADDYASLAESRAYGPGQGIAYGTVPSSRLTRFADGSLIASTNAGIYRWESGRFVSEKLAGLQSLRGENELLDFAITGAGEVWAYSDRHVFRRAPSSGWQREELGGILQGALQSARAEPDGSLLFTATGSVLQHDARQAPAPGPAPVLRLRSIEQLNAHAPRARLPRRPESVPRFVQDVDLGFSFRYALPEYRRKDAVRYQARLAGLNENFSDWSEATTHTYTRLEPGEYRFEARASDALGQVSESEPFRFVIEPRWYASLWGRLLIAAVLAAGLALLNALAIRFRTRRLSAANVKLESVVAQRTRELESANRQLQAMAHLDGLTEIPNRRRLDDYLSEVWQKCAGQQRAMSVLVIDGDHFKTYNDQHGHLAGDTLLRRLAEVLSGCLRRAEDLVARYGGDEFVVVMPGAELQFAREVAEEMRESVQQARLGITISIGMAARCPRPDEPVSTLVHEADEALYEAKRKGRNRAVAYGAGQ